MKTQGLCAVLFAFLLPGQSFAAMVTLSISPRESVVATGDLTVLDLLGTYEGPGSLLGGAVSLNYSADIIEFVSLNVIAPRDVAESAGEVTLSGTIGSISPIGFATFTGVSGPFTIATVEFRALQNQGVASLNLFDANDQVFSWFNDSLDQVPVTAAFGTISAVPLPSSWTLMIAGLGVLGASRLRRERTAES
jgi:hypothetical protein